MNNGYINKLNSIPMEKIFSLYGVEWEEGRNFKCPFPSHGATGATPSGHFYPRTNSYGCFGCRKGGGPINFIMNMENCSFKQACEILSKKFNIELSSFSYDRLLSSYETKEQKYISDIKLSHFLTFMGYNYRDRAKMSKATKLLLHNSEYSDMDFLHALLAGEEPELDTKWEDYFKSLTDKDSAMKFLSARKLHTYVGFAEGVSYPFPELTGRANFPLIMYPDILVGSTARTIEHDNPLKYITLIDYDITKSHFLYNINVAYEEILRCDFVIVVEGVVDALRLVSLGYNNVVAPLGTLLSDFHIRYLSNLSKNFLLMFDGDAAGQHAYEETYKKLIDRNLNVYSIALPDGEDPDSCGLKEPLSFKSKLDIL